MKRVEIPLEKFILPVFSLWGSDWFLLTSGDFKAGKFNTMTVAWGGFGIMWGKPFAMVVVRPSRYTFKFMETFNTFTLSAFPPNHKKALNYCGTKSGRDVDKIKETGLTPIASSKITAPGFDEAELILECKKIYFEDFSPENFLDTSIEGNYSGSDYHRSYYGEILSVSGDDKYSVKS